MNQLIKDIALTLPPLKRLYAEREQLREENQRLKDVREEVAVEHKKETQLGEEPSIRMTEGYCPFCGSETKFVAGDYWLRDHYLCTQCNSIPRQRALMKILKERYPDYKMLDIHESSPSDGVIRQFQNMTENYSYSYYYEDIPLGSALTDGGTNQDLEHLTFADDSFDIFITQDVMEHIPNPEHAFLEIARVLRKGGAHIFTTPIYLFTKSKPRIQFKDGKWVNIFPPVYHGNPIDEKGSLVTWDWGDDIAELIDDATHCTKTEIIQFPHTKENYEMGLEADFLQVIISKKIKE